MEDTLSRADDSMKDSLENELKPRKLKSQSSAGKGREGYRQTVSHHVLPQEQSTPAYHHHENMPPKAPPLPHTPGQPFIQQDGQSHVQQREQGDLLQSDKLHTEYVNQSRVL